jgi:hypothetical protein
MDISRGDIPDVGAERPLWAWCSPISNWHSAHQPREGAVFVVFMWVWCSSSSCKHGVHSPRVAMISIDFVWWWCSSVLSGSWEIFVLQFFWPGDQASAVQNLMAALRKWKSKLDEPYHDAYPSSAILEPQHQNQARCRSYEATN